MFLSRYFLARSNIWKNYLLTDSASNNVLSSVRKYSCLTKSTQQTCKCWKTTTLKSTCTTKIYRIYSSEGLINGDITELQEKKREKQLHKISQLFPQPKQTLNELASKVPQKMFDIYYKQMSTPPKGNKKRLPNGEWVCTYAFTWPNKMKFESTAKSKSVASDKAACQALNWLHENKHVDRMGNPIHNQEVLNNLQSTLNPPIRACISENSVNRIDKIWDDYESEIKSIYQATFEEAARKEIKELPLLKDSSLDEEDEFSDNEGDIDSDDISAASSLVHPVYGKNIKQPSNQTLERNDRRLKQTFQQYDDELTPLPIDDYAEKITSSLESSRVLVIVGAAGCGKSTRVPAAILRKCGVRTTAIVSEPRRVAAIGLAQRVASELREEVGESIGYQVRLQSKLPKPPCGSVLYCTSGILLRRLKTNPGLEGCSHVMIDEAHERDINTDIMILLLKRALAINTQLKIVIMSATLDVDVFTRYFDSCPVIEVPGRTFPVEVSYLEDIQRKYGLKLNNSLENSKKDNCKPAVSCPEVVEVIKAVDRMESEGAILVFLPGWAEIKYTKMLLDEHYGQSTTHMVLPVHSRLSTQDQIKMFAKPPPGIRKIVLATTIAETSITIPDVVHVVDSGVFKEHRTKEGTGTASLEKAWVSQSSAKQRAGRAGRVQPGHCYRLYTKEKELELIPHNSPEILRVPLEQTVLDCKTYAPGDKVEDFLSQLPEPPSRKSIEFAVNDLIDLGALTPSEEMTRLGSLLSSFPVRPRLAYSLLISAAIGNILSVANVIAYCANDLPVSKDTQDSTDFRDLKRTYSDTCDFSALYWLQNEFETLDSQSGRDSDVWCDKHHLRKDRLRYVKSLSSLHLEQLLKSGVESNPEPSELTRFSGVDELTSAVLLAGSNSLLITRKRVKTKGKLATATELFTSTSDRAHIGSESVNYGISKRTANTQLLTYNSGRHSTERRALVIYNTSLVSPHIVLLFSKGDIHEKVLDEEDGNTTVLTLPRHNLSIYVPTSQVSHILKAREMLWNTFQYYIERDLSTMDYDSYLNVARFKVRLVKAIGRVLVEGFKSYQGKKLDSDDDS